MTTVSMLLGQADDVQLSVAGALIMLFSITLVIGLNVFCLYRITREKKPRSETG